MQLSENYKIQNDTRHHEDQNVNNNPQTSHVWIRLALIISVVWGAALIVLFIIFLYDPSFKQWIIDMSRRYGSTDIKHIAALVLIETVFLLLGFSASVPELCFAFFLQNYAITFLISVTSRQAATQIAYCVGRYIFRQALDEYMKTFRIYRCLERMLVSQPYKTMFIVRFSMLPNFIKYYGLPALNPSLKKLSILTFMSSIFQAHFYILPGYLARSEAEIKTQDFKDSNINLLMYICGIFYVVMFIVLCVVVKLEMDKVEAISLREDQNHKSQIDLE